MREFRWTSTSAVEILLKSDVYRAHIRLHLLQTGTRFQSSNELFERFTKSCFSNYRSTEAMTGAVTVNEDAVLKVLFYCKCVHTLYIYIFF